MPHHELRVTTAHLHDLAATQTRAAADITSASQLAADTDHRIRSSHGVIASDMADAVTALQRSRRNCGMWLVEKAETLGANLTEAARRYEASDERAGAEIDQQLQPR